MLAKAESRVHWKQEMEAIAMFWKQYSCLAIWMLCLVWVSHAWAADAELAKISSHDHKYSVVLEENGASQKRVRLRRERDVKSVAEPLSFVDGINVNSLDARWSPDDSTVVLVVDRRQTCDLIVYKLEADGAFRELAVPALSIEKMFASVIRDTDMSAGESTTLGVFNGDRCSILMEQSTRTEAGARTHHVFEVNLVLKDRKCELKDVKKVGALAEAEFDKVRKTFRARSQGKLPKSAS